MIPMPIHLLAMAKFTIVCMYYKLKTQRYNVTGATDCCVFMTLIPADNSVSYRFKTALDTQTHTHTQIHAHIKTQSVDIHKVSVVPTSLFWFLICMGDEDYCRLNQRLKTRIASTREKSIA